MRWRHRAWRGLPAVHPGQRNKLERELEDAIAPGHSGILALVSDPGAVEIRKALDRADRIVQSA